MSCLAISVWVTKQRTELIGRQSTEPQRLRVHKWVGAGLLSLPGGAVYKCKKGSTELIQRPVSVLAPLRGFFYRRAQAGGDLGGTGMHYLKLCLLSPRQVTM